MGIDIAEAKNIESFRELHSTLNPFNTLKVLMYRDKLEAIARGEIPDPVTAELDPSNICDHDCIFCSTRELRQRDKSVMSRKRMLTLVEELSEMGVKGITVGGGGEPLMSPHVDDLLHKCQDHKIEVGLVTNGSRLIDHEEVISETCKYVRISIDAGTRETHNLVHRKKDDFETIMNSIIDLRRVNKNLIIGFAFLVQKENYKEVYRACRLFKKVGADYGQFRPVLKITPETHEITEKEYPEALKQLKRAKRDFEDEKFKVYGIMHRFSMVLKKELSPTKCYTTPLIAVCMANCQLALCCNTRDRGQLHDPSNYYDKYVIGSFKDKPLKEVWGSDRHKKLISNIDVKNCTVCRYVPYNYLFKEVILKDEMHRCFL